MAAPEQEENPEHQNHHPDQKLNDHQHCAKLVSSYLGLSFTVFLGLLPTSLSALRSKNRALSFQLMQAEEQLKHLHSRRKEDSKANARVVEIFASHRHAWQQEEKRLLQQIDDCNQEISYLKGKVEDFERLEAEMKANIEDLKREIGERDEMMNFMSRSDCDLENTSGEGYRDMGLRYGNVGVFKGVEKCFVGGGWDELRAVYGQSESGFNPDFLNSAASKLWSAKGSPWQDTQYESLEPTYHLKHFVARRESPWKGDGESAGVTSKLKVLEQELLNLERVGDAGLSEVPSKVRKQAKRYQALAGKIDDLCGRMKASDQNEPTLISEFQTRRQTEFLLEAFQLQQRASEVNDKLIALQTEAQKVRQGEELEGQTRLATKRIVDSLRNNFKEIQRNLEIHLARIIGDLKGTLTRDGVVLV